MWLGVVGEVGVISEVGVVGEVDKVLGSRAGSPGRRNAEMSSVEWLALLTSQSGLLSQNVASECITRGYGR